MKYGLKEDEIENIKAIFKAHSAIDEVILYGSRAMDNHKSGSDIDLTIKGSLDLTDLTKITAQLDDLVIPFRFDVSLYHQIDNKHLMDHIRRAGIVFYKNRNAIV